MFPSSSGQSRRTLFNGEGCGSCHGGSNSTATQLSVPQAIDNKIFVTPGQSIRLDVIVANASQRNAGVNIAVKSSLTSESNAGTLALAQGNTALRTDFSGELTHRSPLAFSGGRATFTFEWTAPQAEGSVFLRATGNAVNRDGGPAGDQWNYLQPVEIVVGPTSSVQQAYSSITAHVSPLPSHDGVTAYSQAGADEQFAVSVIDAVGNVVFSDVYTPSTESVQYTWPGTTSSGTPVPSGSYVVALISERRTILGKAIIQR
jgi:hypothetical protein